MFSTVAPVPALRPWVRDYLLAHFRFDPTQPIPHKRYAPKPEQGITFFVKGPPRIVSSRTGCQQVAPPVAIFGQHTRRCDVHLAPEFLMLRVHLQPGALFRLLGVPLREFGEDYFDAELVLGSEAREATERMALSTDANTMVQVAEECLLRWTARAKHKVRPVDRVAEQLTANPLHHSLDGLARQACLSRRQLNRTFTERMGAGPKLYQRLVRFHGAHQFKTASPHVAWPIVALKFGYTDYQHMVRDFREFTDATPNRWLQEDRSSPENARPGLVAR